MDNLLKAAIEKMPKLELHIHLEGVFTKELVCELAKKNGVKLPRSKEELFAFTGLSDFLELLDFNCSCVYDEDDARKLAYSFCQYAKQQNIIYAEVITNPTHWHSLSYERMIPAVLEGFADGAKDGLCDCRLLVSLLRTQSTESASETVDWLIAHPNPRLIGLSVDGDETAAKSNERFAPLFRKAKESGLHLTAHAGESSGPEGVREALELLGAERIDHGVRAIEDDALMEELREKRIPCNVCFTSNVDSGLFTEENHPLKALYDRGLCVNLSTDDPMILDNPLCYELCRVANLYGWQEDTLRALERNAVEAAFCSEIEKAKLLERLSI